MIDLKGALAALEGDRELLQDCLALLMEDLPLRLEDLRKVLAAGDLGHAARIAHAIKGSVAVVGAVGLKNCAFALEAACAREQLLEARERFADLWRQWEELCRFLTDEKLI
ncbi:Hpt domain-containing protein [Geoalkalibacter halelectricus]|uniref:Hpt domain-containing protein n=1 Tax=Geoalkalibacter halelectricus TaxID=2847045 RepID=A0ABY5ZPZ2_9BACT|nr:Hpt domain-containing protein [Geoalkalibacter halelectricus]MDO3378672.1 Hpt domain-containing protein [Geoalkalibacter halelectricus]UWZ80017.1 Hpt domain-containing protein [Geoalkalibacter halelectricus]